MTLVHIRAHPREFLSDIPASADTTAGSSATAYSLLQRDDASQYHSGPHPACLPPPPCQGPNCVRSPGPPCLPLSSYYPPTWTPTSAPHSPTSREYPTSYSDTTADTSAVTSPSASGSATVSMTVTVSPTGTSIPVLGPPPPHDPSRPLTTVQIAGIALGSVLGALLLGVFLWLIRRGTFGSGTLFGFRYGNARRAGWRPGLGTGNAQAEMSQTGNVVGSTGNLISPFGADAETSTSLPSYPSSTLATSADSLPFIPRAKLLPTSSAESQVLDPPRPPRSPAVWSTSPSAFDNAYGSIVAGTPSTIRPSTAGSGSRRTLSVSMSEATTLVADRVTLGSLSTPVRSYIPTPSPTYRPDVGSYLSSARATPTRTPSPAPTLGAASTIEGVRISSWHSSDSEETELIVRPLPRR